jgi:cobalt/nickel transport system permease protein
VHIPDGYLGPQTYLPAYAVMAGYWALASARLKRTLRLRQVPLLALGAAFSFVIMMFNVPIPGGTTGHAVGAVLIAIVLGPWAAGIAVSLALILQALLFGDGGITAIGANCLNMAVIMPLVGWGAYRLIAGGAPVTSRRHWLGAAVGGYVGLNAAALSAAVMFGIQPLLARDAAGHALYSPFGLHLAVPAMALEHLLVFGWVEAAVTGLVVAYLQRTAPELLPSAAQEAAPGRRKALLPRLGLALAVLALLSPLGLYLPHAFHAGSAWGEWGADEIRAELARETGGEGYVPAGLARAERSGWKAPLPDYSLRGQRSPHLPALSASYILSAAVGVVGLVLLTLATRRVWARKDEGGTAELDADADQA